MLNIYLCTLLLQTVENGSQQSQTLSNTLKLGSQLTLVKQRIQRYIDSSLILIVKAIKKLIKGVEIIAYSLVLITKRNAKLKVVNKVATQQRLYKRKQIQQKETLIVNKGVRLITLKEFRARSNRKKVKKKVYIKVGKLLQRRYRRYSKTRYNLRIYK